MTDGTFHVAVIGTGLIGASWGLALRAADLDAHVVGWDRDAHELDEALAVGALHRAADTPEEAVEGARLVVLAVPAAAVPEVTKRIGPSLAPGAVLTDVASVKGGVVEALQTAAPPSVHVVGGHPMAGSHERGAAHAHAEMFVGATYLLTPTTHTAASAYQLLHRVVSAIGARPLVVDPGTHDDLVAVVSHLPQLAASTLMNLAAERARRGHAGLLLLAAGGFRDTTRVAASQPDFWVDVCLQNRDAIVTALDEFSSRLTSLRAAVATGDDRAIRGVLDEARTARRSLPGKRTATGTMVDVVVAIPDRPGVLAAVTRLVGETGVNIEDLRIEHASEGGRGALSLAILGDDHAATAATALRDAGFEVWLR